MAATYVGAQRAEDEEDALEIIVTGERTQHCLVMSLEEADALIDQLLQVREEMLAEQGLLPEDDAPGDAAEPEWARFCGDTEH